MTSNGRSYYWCFTLNNYSPDQEEALKSLCGSQEERKEAKYLVYGRETGESGTPHLQGYVEFWARTRFDRVRRLLPTGTHIEQRRGSAEQAIDYCKKDGVFVELGEPTLGSQGKRTDLDAVGDAVRAGASLSSIADEHFGTFVRYHRGIERARQLRVPPRTWKSCVVVKHGPTGTGKTRSCMDCEQPPTWIYGSDGWFDGYEGDEVVLFDDFGGHEFKLTYLLKLLDRYPMRVRVKGGFVQWSPRTIYITSNLGPEEWYPNAKAEHKEALMRRLDEVLHVAEPLYEE